MNQNTAVPGARPWDHETIESRYAHRVVAVLTDAGDNLPHDISERLRVARDLALEKARIAQQRHGTSGTSVGGGTMALGGGGGGWGWRLAALAPVVTLILGIYLIQSQSDLDDARTTADIDAAILSDDLPPVAYADRGFAEFLRRQER